MTNTDTGQKTSGCNACPPQSPWPKKAAVLTFLPWPFIVGLAAYILWQTSLIMLVVWMTAFLLFAIPLRYLVCAPCPYYGQSCSTIMGKTVPLIFRHRPGGPLVLGLWLDIVSFAVLSIIPVPYAFQLGGAALTAIWLGAFALFLVSLAVFGCRYCPFTYCPIGKAGRIMTRLFRGQQRQ